MAAELDYLPTYLHQPELIDEIDVEQWDEAFTALGFPDPLKPDDLKAKDAHARIAAVVFSEKLKPMWGELFEILEELGTDAGREALINALDDAGIDRRAWSDLSARSLAHLLWLRRDTVPELVDAIDRARVHVFETGTRRPHHEYAGKQARDVAAHESMICKHVLVQTSAWCKANDRGEFVEVKCYLRGEHYVFQVVHGEPIKTQMAIDETGRSRVRYRPGLSDLIRYDAKDGRLRVSARSKLAHAYRQIFGQALFADGNFFSEQARCTLRPLQERGATLFDELPSSIARARVTHVVWHPANGHASIEVFADDAIAEMARLNLSLTEGTISEATFEFAFFNGGKIKRKQITIHPPIRVFNPPGRYADRIDALLLRLGIRVAADPDGTSTLWGLFPWVHSEGVWKDALGLPHVATLLRAGLLVPADLEAVANHDVASGPNDLRVDRSEGERIDGVSRLADVPSKRLNATEISGLKLEAQALAVKVAGALRYSARVKPIPSTIGGFDLGWRDFGRTRVHAFFLARQPGTNTNLALRLAKEAAGAKVLIVVPSGCRTDFGLPEVQLEGGADPFDRLMARSAEALELWKEVPAIELADPGAELVIDRFRQTIHLRGTHLSSIDGQSLHFKLLLMLAAAKGTVVPSDELNRALGDRQDGAKDAAKAARAGIKLSFKKAGLLEPDPDQVFGSGNGGYALRVPCFVN